jgi:5,10-methylenetetrahydromethanopterin reductase
VSPLEIGLSIRPAAPALDVADAVAADREGFDVGTYGDSQCYIANPFARMAAAATVTERLRFATCGLPPATRHPSVAAASAITVNWQAPGRVILGVARGDSALLTIGRPGPATLSEFVPFARDVRAYLRGEAVPSRAKAPAVTFAASAPDLPSVPLEISASGPKTIAAGAAIADRLTFYVGAQPDRIEWALGVAHEAAARAGRDPAEIQYGVWINICVGEDRDATLEAMRSAVVSGAHFNCMPGTDFDLQPPELRRITEPMSEAYARQAEPDYERKPVDCVDRDFVDYFGAVGSVEHVIAKLKPLTSLGLGHIYFINGGGGDLQNASRAHLAAVAAALRD